jgi:hypothetical protein
MADPIDYDRLAEAIADAIDSKGTAEALDRETEALRETTREKLKFIKSMRESSSVTATFSKILTGKTEDLSATIEKNRKVLDDLSEKYEQASTDEQRRQIKEEQRETRRAVLFQNLSVAFAGASLGVIKFTATLVDAAGAAGAQLVRGIQNSSNGVQMGANILNAGVGLANSAAQGLAGITTAVGTGLMAVLKGPFKLLGAAVAGLGTAFGFLAERVSRVVKFGIEILSVELEKTISGFRATTQAGALFADGLTGMRVAARSAMLTVDQFAKVLSVHSRDLAQLGMGVTQGALKMGRVLSTGGDQMRDRLLKLGYSFEEQAGLVAETMSQMRGLGGPLRATDTEIVQQTQKYAESLRLIAGITGEDAKKKVEQARQQSRVLAFQQYLAGKDEKQRLAINAAMATMTEAEKRNLMDRAVLGTVINKEGAIYEATVAGARAKGEEAFRLLQTNNLTAEANARLNAQYGGQIKESTMAQKSIAIAGYVLGGQMGNVAAAMLESAEQATIYMADAVKSAAAAVEAQATTNDKLTNSLNSATIAAQNMAIKLQELLDPFLEMYADITAKMLTEIEKTFSQMQKEIGAWARGEKSPTATSERLEGIKADVAKKGETVESVGSKVKYAGAGIAGLGALATVAGAIMSLTGVGAAAGVPLMAAGGKMIAGGAKVGLAGWTMESAGEFAKDQAKEDGLVEKIGKMIGYRRGGISKGPGSGYLQKLHGTEAIVPLPDGKNIPVKVNLGAALNDAGIDLNREPVQIELGTMLKEAGVDLNKKEPARFDLGTLLNDAGINLTDNLASVDAFKGSIDYGAETFKDTFNFVKTGINSTESMMSTYIDDILAKLSSESTETVSRVIDEFNIVSKNLFRDFGKGAEDSLKSNTVSLDTIKTRSVSPGAVGLESSKTELRIAKPMMDSVVNELKEKIELTSVNTVESKLATTNLTLDQESILQLRSAMTNNNQEVTGLLTTQNDLLQQSILSMDRLAGLMSDTYTVNNRMYREMT